MLFGSCDVVAGAELRHEAPSHTIPNANAYRSVFQVAIKHTVSKQRISLRIHHNGKSTDTRCHIPRRHFTARYSGGWDAVRPNALTCCTLRFVELTAGDQSAPEGYLFSALVLTPSRISYVIRQCATEIKNALAAGEAAGRFDYHKSMELTGFKCRGILKNTYGSLYPNCGSMAH
jgi:hypothetical protein